MRKSKLAEKSNIENIVDQDLIRELQASLSAEDAPDFQDLTKLYDEAGIVLPDLPRRRIEEVERSHRTIIENRRSHLGSEIESAEQRIAARDRRKDALNQRRGQIMSLLKSGGALEHYTGLREELGRAEAECEMFKARLETAERFESTRTELNMERARLVKALQDDLHERATRRSVDCSVSGLAAMIGAHSAPSLHSCARATSAPWPEHFPIQGDCLCLYGLSCATSGASPSSSELDATMCRKRLSAFKG